MKYIGQCSLKLLIFIIHQQQWVIDGADRREKVKFGVLVGTMIVSWGKDCEKVVNMRH